MNEPIPEAEDEARRFVEQWVACFEKRDLEGLDRLSHESRPESSRAASRSPTTR